MKMMKSAGSCIRRHVQLLVTEAHVYPTPLHEDIYRLSNGIPETLNHLIAASQAC